MYSCYEFFMTSFQMSSQEFREEVDLIVDVCFIVGLKRGTSS